ncbi:hypothetical protein RHMOL_Rhmol07G0241300 [Rhododendron molle]|uniref:Uncharacterized protein n=1 Tax=Rhododendron molle TaxID=49168 RepID=A0ACC0N673_RHOML|nr:hypothetical protein RHMOL_Rhmol07G0241300 [Rhododendron molle]
MRMKLICKLTQLKSKTCKLNHQMFSFLCLVYMVNRDNEMLPVSVVKTHEDAHASVEDQNIEIDPPVVDERVERHVDAQVPMEEQNREARPPKDETINVSHVSEMVGLHDNAQEANEETNVEFDLPNGEIVQQQRHGESVIEVSNVHVNCTTVITQSGEKSSGRDGIDKIEETGSDGILKRRRIKKVHQILRSDRRNKGCYDPEVVSVGPYHHGKKKLQKAEKLKPLVAEMLVSRCTSHNMDEFRQKVLEKADDAISCYVDGSTDEYSKEEFAEMMLLDACLVLAFIEAPVYQDRSILNNLATCLGVQALHASGTDVFNLLENQIPFLVLETVMTLKYQGDLWIDVLDIFCERRMIFGVEDYTENAISREICEKNPLHLLEYFWLREHAFYQPNTTLKSRGTAGTSAKSRINKFIYSFRSVSELKSKGIHVRPSGVHSRKAVEFTSFFFFGLLKLPPLIFTPEWIIKCSNFVAYELGQNDRDNLPTMAYVNFMKLLINGPDDVKELRSKSILFTTFSSDKQVIERFNGIMITSVAEDFKLYDEVEEQIQMYYHSKLKAWIAELLHNHFTSPWTFIAFLAGTSLLVFTFPQTYFTMYPQRDRF